MTAAVVVPVKAFRAAKRRLMPALDPAARAALAQRMATHVVAAAAPLPVTVVGDDAEVAAWARGLGVRVAWTPGLGLDGAVQAGVEAVTAGGAHRIVVAHADLPLARDLASLVGPGDPDPTGVTLVPDRWGDGTNVIVIPAGCGFRFAYGSGSYARHRAEGERLGLAVRTVHDPRLGWDVDLPPDLDLPTEADLARAAAGVRPR